MEPATIASGGHAALVARTLRSNRAPPAVLLGLLVLGFAGFSLEHHSQLGTIGGFTAQDFALGLNLASYGTIGIGDQPTIFKAPGDALLVATVTRLAVGRPSIDPDRTVGRRTWRGLVPPYAPSEIRLAARALYATHAVLLALGTAVLFLWLSSFASRTVSFALSLAFGASPLALVLVGLLHYALPHLVLLIVSVWLLQRAVADGRSSSGRMALAGLAWGLTTTVRSLTLPLPAFVLIALLVGRRPWREVVKLSTVFALTFALALAPASVRASRLAGRFVAVNAQLWAILWNATAREAPAMPNHFRWKVFRQDFLELQSATASRRLESAGDPYGVAENLKMEDIGRAGTFEHLRRDPRPYLANVAHSFLSFNWDVSAVLVQLFQYAQRAEPARWPAWFSPGQSQDFHPLALREAYTILVRILTVLAAVGLVIAVRRREFAVVPAVAVYACLCAAHSAVWLDVLYYYAKLPFLYAIAAYCLDRLGSDPRRGVALLARTIAVALVATTLAMTAVLLWPE